MNLLTRSYVCISVEIDLVSARFNFKVDVLVKNVDFFEDLNWIMLDIVIEFHPVLHAILGQPEVSKHL